MLVKLNPQQATQYLIYQTKIAFHYTLHSAQDQLQFASAAPLPAVFFFFFNRMDIFFHFCLFLPQSFWHFPPVSHTVGPSQDDLLTGCFSSQRRWEIGIRQPVPICYWIACGDSNKCYFICHQSHLMDGLTGRQPSRSCPHSRQGGRTKTRLLGVYSN